eukprot:jgi/Undpi1/8901/HiC_scaffold_25.g11363.m1
MKISSASQASLLLALIAGFSVSEATRHRLIVRSYRTNYKIDWWDNGRADPYRIIFKKSGLKSVYKFLESGSLSTLTIGNTRYTFSQSAGSLEVPSSEDIGSRMLLAPEDEDAEEVHFGHRRLYDCPDCEETWDTLCDVGIEEVCGWVELLPSVFESDAQYSLTVMCTAMAAACDTSAADTCEGQCIEALDAFYIEVDYIGTWTDARKAVFDTAAARWSQVITHVPCGGTNDYPAGRLLISATLKEIDGTGGTLGSAGPTSIWNSCNTISLLGAMTFDIDDIENMEDNGTFEGVIQHEMGHVIGVGTLWGVGYGDCTTCRDDGDPAWTCPAALSEYYDIGGTDANIVETDGGTGTSCGHLDEDIFDDELMTGYVYLTMHMSKMTAAILDDLDYIVDPSAVDSYTLPSERGTSIEAEEGLAITFNDTVVDTIILVVSEDGTSVEKEGVMMVF